MRRLAVMALLLTAGCAAREGGARPQVRAAVQRYLAHTVAHIGVAESLFAAEGLDVEMVHLGGPAEALPLLLSGQIDVIFGSLTPGAISAMARGEPVRIVAVRNVFDSTRCASAGIVESLARPAPPRQAPVLSLERDLAWQYLTERTLTLAGHSIEAFRRMTVPNVAEIEGLRDGTIDFALTGEPWLTRTQAAGVARRWLSMDSLMHGESYSYIFFGPTLLGEGRRHGEAFMRAYLAAAARFAQGANPRNLDIVAGVTGEPRDQLARTCWPAVSADGRLDPHAILTFQRWARHKGYIDREAAIGQVWDSSFVTAAAVAARE
jgi:ABC-type nitrate/sulfonate/bicarbonate transport system substrate-binding protein